MLPFAQFSVEEESGKSRRIGASGVNSQFINRAEALLLQGTWIHVLREL